MEGRVDAPDRSGRVAVGLFVGIGVLAFALRASYVRKHPWLPLSGNDNTWYATVGRSFAEGDWGRVPGLDGKLVDSARFPHAYPLVLAVGQRLLFWIRPYWAQLWTSAALGTAGALLTTALAWRLTAAATLRLRVVAAFSTGALIACNPVVIGASAALMSEVLYVPLVAAFLLLVDAVMAKPATVSIWILLGIVVAGAAFTRGEGLVLLGVPLVALAILHRHSRPVRVGLLAVVGSATLMVVLWSAVLSMAAGRPVLMSTNGASVLFGATCPQALHGDGRGSWDGECLPPPDDEMSPALRAALQTPVKDPFALAPQWSVPVEAELGSLHLQSALHRMGDDPGAIIGTIPFRWARAVGVLTTHYDERVSFFEGRDADLERVGALLQKVVVLPLVVLFLVALARRRSRLGSALREVVEPVRLVPAGLLVATWLVLITATYGSARFRQPVEPVFALVCGLAVASIRGALQPRPIAPGLTRGR